jgi:hypothetical protein
VGHLIPHQRKGSLQPIGGFSTLVVALARLPPESKNNNKPARCDEKKGGEVEKQHLKTRVPKSHAVWRVQFTTNKSRNGLMELH